MKCEGCIFNEMFPSEHLLSSTQIVEIAKDLKLLGYKQITITGGDPIRRDDLPDILKGLKALGFKIHLDTTGFPFLNENANSLLRKIRTYVDLIGIPLDGSTDDIMHTFRTNSPLTVEKIKDILKVLSSYGFNIAINTVLHEENFADLQNMYDILAGLPAVKRWELHEFSSFMSYSKKPDFHISRNKVLQEIDNYANKQIDVKYAREKARYAISYNGLLIYKDEEILDLKTATISQMREYL